MIHTGHTPGTSPYTQPYMTDEPLFSNIFMEVNAVSQILWQFNRYAQVMEYEQKPWLPPPFTILFYIYRVIKFTCFRRWTGRSRPTFDYRLSESAVQRVRVRHAKSAFAELFLKPGAIEKLLDFEEECVEDLQREKNELSAAAAEVRLQEAADRYDRRLGRIQPFETFAF